jgi:hypothetical protein
MRLRRFNENRNYDDLKPSEYNQIIDNMISKYFVNQMDVEDMFSTNTNFTKIHISHTINQIHLPNSSYDIATIKNGDEYSKHIPYMCKWIQTRKDDSFSMYSIGYAQNIINAIN